MQKLSLNYFDKMGKESKESGRVAAARSDSDDDDEPIGAMYSKKRRKDGEDAESEKQMREEEKKTRQERNVQNRVVVRSGLGNRFQEQEGKGIEKRRETKAFDGGKKCKSKLSKGEQGGRSGVDRKEDSNKSSSRDGEAVHSGLGSGSGSTKKRLRDGDVMVPRADKKKKSNAKYDDRWVKSMLYARALSGFM